MSTEGRGQTSSSTPNTVTVIGAGSVSRMPVSAYFTADVEERAEDVEVAYGEATVMLKRLVAALLAAGADEEQIESSGVSVRREWEWEYAGDDEQKVHVFSATGSVNVEVAEPEQAAELALACSRAGAESVSRIGFRIADWEAAHIEALNEAAASARQRAEALAVPLGRSVGKALEITTTWEERGDSDWGWGGGTFFVRSSAADEEAAPPTRTKHYISGRARVTFELE